GQKKLRPPECRRGAPLGKKARCAVERCLCFIDTSDANASDDLFWIGGIDRLEPLAIAPLWALSFEFGADMFEGSSEAFTVFLARKIDQRLVAKLPSSVTWKRLLRNYFFSPLFRHRWSLDQSGDILFVGIGLAQERSIGGIFHESADQIGNPRQQFAHGKVDPNSLAVLNNRLAHRFSHAVEHLNLVAVGRNA